MENSNECKKNFVAVYDGSSAIEDLKAKFCSTVANDIMLDHEVGVVRMWADETSRLSRFRMLYTIFAERESVCLSVCLSVSLSVCLSVCLSLSLCLSLCVSLSHCLSVCLSLSTCLSLPLSLCLFLSLSLSVCLCL